MTTIIQINQRNIAADVHLLVNSYLSSLPFVSLNLFVYDLLQSLLSDEQVAGAPVLILGNKIDVPGAASEDEIRHMFGLHGQTTGRVRIRWIYR